MTLAIAARSRVAGYRLLLPGATYVALTAYMCGPLFVNPDGLAAMDWDVHFVYYQAVIRSLYEYAQLPFWNPWYCGGNVLWQNPQVALLSPVYLLAPLMSLPLAMKLNIALHYLLGFAGMHLLLRRTLGLTFSPAVIFLASLFTLAGGHALHLGVGHTTFLPFLYLPFQLFCFLRALETGRLRDVLWAAAWSALAIYNGGIHAVAMGSVAIGVFSIAAAASRRNWRPLVLLACFGAAAVLYAAPKLVPVARYLSDDRFVDGRNSPGKPDSMTLDAQLSSLIDPHPFRGGPPLAHGWHEYGNYIGLVGTLLILASAAWIAAHRPWERTQWLGVSLAVTALVLVLLWKGDFSAYAPAMLLKRLPLFSGFQAPSRYVLVFSFFAPLMVAWAMRAGTREAPPSGGLQRLIGIVLLLAAVDLAYHNRANFENVFTYPPLDVSAQAQGRAERLVLDAAANAYAPNSPMLRSMMDNRSVLECYEPLLVRRSVDPGQEVVFAGGEASLHGFTFSPNRIKFVVLTTDADARVYLNQNYITGWRSDAGPISLDGHPHVNLGTNRAGRFSFVFVPPGLTSGLLLFGLGVVVSVWGWKRRLWPPEQWDQ